MSATSPRRILHLVHVFPPETRGGTEGYVEMVARAQRARGIDARVIAGSERAGEEEPRHERDETGLPILRLPPNGDRRETDWSCPSTRELLAATFREAPGAIVHLHHWHNLVSDALRCAREHGARTVVTLHDYFATCPLFFRVRADWSACDGSVRGETCVRCVAAAYAHRPDDVRPHYHARQAAFRADLEAAEIRLTVSEASASLLRETETFEGLPLEVLPLPGPPPPPPVPWTPDPDGRLRVISWGALVPGKGFHLLVEAVRGMPERDRIELHHHGTIVDEAYAARVREEGRELCLHLHGRFDPETLRRDFGGHDVAVFPSYYMETHGLVVDEAMQLGLPVLVSDRGAPPTRVGDKGLVFPAGDARALAARLEECLDDPERLAALRAAPPPRPLGLEDHVDRLTALYQRLTPRA